MVKFDYHDINYNKLNNNNSYPDNSTDNTFNFYVYCQ